jgi:hypothetical protein
MTPPLLRPPLANVAMLNPGGFNREGEGKGELLAPIALQPADLEGEDAADLAEKRLAGLLAQPRIETEDAQPGAIVEGGVLIDIRTNLTLTWTQSTSTEYGP